MVRVIARHYAAAGLAPSLIAALGARTSEDRDGRIATSGLQPAIWLGARKSFPGGSRATSMSPDAQSDGCLQPGRCMRRLELPAFPPEMRDVRLEHRDILGAM